ncbi:hypothetical protein KDA11_06495 [Candidatus Saccharibacteria bacterium]|nr:hypothetical protein [Candidatus Saccharibacteria bacterium]
MNEQEAKELIDKIIGQVFGFQNPLTLEQAMQKFAFDIRLPQQVVDSSTGQATWAQSTSPTRFISFENALNKPQDAYVRSARQLNSIEDILGAWSEINEMTTERYLDSINIAQSDNIYSSENVFRSQDIRGSKNVIFCDGLAQGGCEFVLACQRSSNLSFCIRVEDSSQCSNSFNVQWCKNIVNSMFISDAQNMQDSLFCSHITNKRFMVANMQFDETEYRRLRDIVARWILTA